ncbi:MAG TPA: hypothetical protein VIH59_27480 [Candidatus Tectomicrobia bacterium]
MDIGILTAPDGNLVVGLIRWACESWEALRPFAAGRVYVHSLGEEGADRVREPTGLTTTGWWR